MAGLITVGMAMRLKLSLQTWPSAAPLEPEQAVELAGSGSSCLRRAVGTSSGGTSLQVRLASQPSSHHHLQPGVYGQHVGDAERVATAACTVQGQVGFTG